MVPEPPTRSPGPPVRLRSLGVTTFQKDPPRAPGSFSEGPPPAVSSPWVSLLAADVLGWHRVPRCSPGRLLRDGYPRRRRLVLEQGGFQRGAEPVRSRWGSASGGDVLLRALLGSPAPRGPPSWCGRWHTRASRALCVRTAVQRLPALAGCRWDTEGRPAPASPRQPRPAPASPPEGRACGRRAGGALPSVLLAWNLNII